MLYTLWQFIGFLLGIAWIVILIGLIVVFIIALAKYIYETFGDSK
ncbi:MULTISPECIES: hypothetical protein [Streptococcus]|nr:MULTISPECIES: hypothetical protein [unclassified Streptococcus]